MLVLAFDTSTPWSAVGWAEVDASGPRPAAGRSASSVVPAEPGHAETLLGRIGAALAAGGFALRDVDLLVFGRGPGTFTGLRIGLATAKGLALAFGTKLVGVSSLEALALSAGAPGLVAPLIDARRGELYAALYEIVARGGAPAASPVAGERVTRPGGIPELLGPRAGEPVLFVGNGALRYSGELRPYGEVSPPGREAADPVRLALRGVERLLESGADDPLTLEPSYLREPDARLPKPAFPPRTDRGTPRNAG